ncbi:MAG: DEAD/DEAH box helicase family protein [Saprospiraceae bacterium]
MRQKQKEVVHSLIRNKMKNSVLVMGCGEGKTLILIALAWMFQQAFQANDNLFIAVIPFRSVAYEWYLKTEKVTYIMSCSHLFRGSLVKRKISWLCSNLRFR